MWDTPTGMEYLWVSLNIVLAVLDNLELLKTNAVLEANWLSRIGISDYEIELNNPSINQRI
jgi:hypothetical protein